MASTTSTPPLSGDLVESVLEHLGIQKSTPGLPFLDTLVNAYVRNVPWESAFRIAKRARTAKPVQCPRWPPEFWTDALERGGGGTCFESNYAFFSLLRALGYQGYLTINDMGESIGCHTACVIYLEESRWLVDVGIPLHMPIPLDAARPTQRNTTFHTYQVHPESTQRYRVERDRHPKPYVFTLVDRRVDDTRYRAATTADYDTGGHFLDQVIVSKIIGDRTWRFNSSEIPWQLEAFGGRKPARMPVNSDAAGLIASHFGMDASIVRAALRALESVFL